MAIDPVVLLISDLHENERRLVAECKFQARSYCPDRAQLTAHLLNRIRALYNELQETSPTSAIGASELIRIIVERLPLSHACHGRHLREIAERLGTGLRQHADLVWIRTLSETLAGGDENSTRIAQLLNLAIRGVCQPVIVHRSVMTKPGSWPALEKEHELPITRAPFPEPAEKITTR